MPFQPQVNQELTIDNVAYRIAVHPAAPGIPYGQEGRQAIVYQLAAESGEKKALKVFKPRYRIPALVTLADRIAAFAELPGLAVCRRKVLSARRHGDLLRQHPDLTYAVLMPWIEGPTWMEVLLRKSDPAWSPLTSEQSLALAQSLAEVLAGMEESGLAHCDLSGPNVLLPMLADGQGIELVDVEQFYSSDLKRPQMLPGGSPGYAHRTAPDGLWSPDADRFAGAILLAEMLGQCDEQAHKAAWGENYFDPQEMQQDSERFQTLIAVLRERWGRNVAGLLKRAWRSDVLADCATFGEWLVTLPEEVLAVIVPSPLPEDEEPVVRAEAPVDAVYALMDLAQQFEEQGKPESALETYRRAQVLAPAGSRPAEELGLIVESLEAEQKARQEVSAIPAPRPPLEEEEEKEPEVVTVSPPVVTEEEEESDLDALFNDGLAAYRRGEWTKARELLAEVVRQQPGYEQDGQKVSSLLAETERLLAPSRRHVPGWAWVAGGLAVLMLVVGVVISMSTLWLVEIGVVALSQEVFVSDRVGKREVYRLSKAGVERMTYTPGDYESWSSAPGAGGAILFTSNRSGKREVYRFSKAGVERMTYTPGDYESWFPAPGAGGTILFTSNRSGKREVYRFSKAGVERMTDTPGDYESWSPAPEPGGAILFTSNRDGKREVYRLSAKALEQMTDTPGSYESWLSISG